MTPLLTAATALLLSLTDPPGDAFGNGSLVPPSAPVYSDLTAFDLRELNLVGDDAIALQIAMGSLSNPADLPLGFTQPVIEVYLDSADGGASELLPGSGMRMPDGVGWEYAVRITGDRAVGYAHQAGATPVELPVVVRTEGNTIVATTPFAAEERVAAYAMVGLYDPLGEAVWRPLTRERSTWSFSSSEQRSPVIDVLAPTVEAQAAAIDAGVLPRPGRTANASLYLLLMAFGLVVALVGLLLRRRVRSDAEPGPADGADSSEPDGAPGGAPGDEPAPVMERAAPPAPPAFRADAAAPVGHPAAEPAKRVGAEPGARRRPFGWNGAATPPAEQPAKRAEHAGGSAAVAGAWLRNGDPFGDEFGAIFGDDDGWDTDSMEVEAETDAVDAVDAVEAVGEGDPTDTTEADKAANAPEALDPAGAIVVPAGAIATAAAGAAEATSAGTAPAAGNDGAEPLDLREDVFLERTTEEPAPPPRAPRLAGGDAAGDDAGGDGAAGDDATADGAAGKDATGDGAARRSGGGVDAAGATSPADEDGEGSDLPPGKS